MDGLQRRSPQESLEYLGLVAAHFPKVIDLPEGIKITAQDLEGAGIQVWRHESGTGHSFVCWPGKIPTPIQIFMPGHAARAIIRQEGWREAILEKQPSAAAATPAPALAAPAAVQGAAAVHDAPPPPPPSAGLIEDTAMAPAVEEHPQPKQDQQQQQQQQDDGEESPTGSPESKPAAATGVDDIAAAAAANAAATQHATPAPMVVDGDGNPDSTDMQLEADQVDGHDKSLSPSPTDVPAEVTPAAAASPDPEAASSAPISSSDKQQAGSSTPITPAAAAAAGAAPTAAEGDILRSAAAAVQKRTRSAEAAAAAAAAAGPAKRARTADTAAAKDAQQGQQQPLSALQAAVSKRTRSAANSDTAAAAAGDARPQDHGTSQPLAALEAAVAAARGRTTTRRSSGGSAGAVPGVEVLKSVEKYTSSTKEVQSKVQQALQTLQDAIKLAKAVQSWSPDTLKLLPGHAILTRGLNSSQVSVFTEEAQAMYYILQADAQQLNRMVAAAGRAGRGSGGGSSSRQKSPGLASPLRRPACAFRSAVEASCADVHSWLKQQRQREVLDQLTALSDVKTLVEENFKLKQQLQQQVAARVEREEQQELQRRREQERLQTERDKQMKVQLEVLLETQRRQKAQQQRNAEHRRHDQQRQQQQYGREPYSHFSDRLQELGNRDVAARGVMPAGQVSPPDSHKAQVRAAAEALMVAARNKAAAAAAAVANGGTNNAAAVAGAAPAGFGGFEGVGLESDTENFDDLGAPAGPAAAQAPLAPAAAAAVAAQDGNAPAFPPNAPGSVLQFLQHLMKSGTGSANGIGHEDDDDAMSEDY